MFPLPTKEDHGIARVSPTGIRGCLGRVRTIARNISTVINTRLNLSQITRKLEKRPDPIDVRQKSLGGGTLQLLIPRYIDRLTHVKIGMVREKVSASSWLQWSTLCPRS